MVKGFNGKKGWAFGHEEVNGNRDRADAEAIYRVLEEEILPLYYKISEDGGPHGWVKVVKDSIKSNAAKFSARRMVRQYATSFMERL